jgi:hypothetical protein
MQVSLFAKGLTTGFPARGFAFKRWLLGMCPHTLIKEIIMRNLNSTELQHVYGGGNTSGGSCKSQSKGKSKCKSQSKGKSHTKCKSHSKGG